MNRKIKKTPLTGGFTLTEALVGTALFIIVFMGIFAAYRLSLKIVETTKNKITAIAIANSRIEIARNLPYESVGTIGASLPDVAGDLEPVETQTVNNVDFAITTRVLYAMDPTDGSGGVDSCNWDYKKVDITVSWGGSDPRQIAFSTDISPKNLVQELQTCLNQPGGVLRVTVFDSAGIPVPSPTIKVYDQTGANLIDSAIPTSGEYSFALEVGTYRVEVTKASWSSARTYATSEVAVPDSPDAVVLDGELTPLSLSIDPAAELSIDGISPTGMDYFADPFDDISHISESDDVAVISGGLTLSGPPYDVDGWAVSEEIAPVGIVSWDEMSFTHNVPAMTSVTYQVLYYNGLDWVLIPDIDLAQNSIGLSSSPIDLSGVPKDFYPQLKLKANFTSADPNVAPMVLDWEVSWITDTGVAVPGAEFHIQGSKTIGDDDLGQPVYKYSENLELDPVGHLDVAGIDGDSYTFSSNATSGFALISTSPSPQPVSADAGYETPVTLFLQAQNALLVSVRDAIAMQPVFSAAVRLHSDALGYDNTYYTDAEGQAYFAPLDNGSYDVDITASGYYSYSGTAMVSGQSIEIFDINHQE